MNDCEQGGPHAHDEPRPSTRRYRKLYNRASRRARCAISNRTCRELTSRSSRGDRKGGFTTSVDVAAEVPLQVHREMLGGRR